MRYLVYEVKNLVNNKTYIGVHRTENINDGYMGSGTHLKRAQSKYGMQNFSRTILFEFDNPEEMFAKEAELVNEEFVLRPDTYNIKIGGNGGFEHIKGKRVLRDEQGQPFLADASYTGNSPGITKGKLVAKNSTGNTFHVSVNDPRLKTGELEFVWKGKKAPKSTRNKMSKTHKERLKDPAKNSQFGTIWITSESEQKNRKIKKDSPLPEGDWKRGRKMYKKAA